MKNKQISESDFITNKILFVFTVSLVGSLALMMIDTLLKDPKSAVVTIYSLQILSFISAIGFAFGLYRQILEKQKKTDVSRKLFNGKRIMILFSVILFCCLFIILANATAAIRTLYIFIPGFAVFYLIRAIYIREFFILSEICAGGALVLWGASKVLAGGHMYLFPLCICFGLLCVFAMTLILKQAKNMKGVFSLGSFTVKVMDKNSDYKISYVTLAILAVLFIAALFVKAQLITYFSFAVLAYLFLMAVYYTVKLM